MVIFIISKGDNGQHYSACGVSAPEYTHGIVDPVEAVSDIAIRKGLPLHVDACFGGFMLPWSVISSSCALH